MRPPEAWDVVVIGSGPAGSTYARVIRDHAPAAKVLLVESGPLIADPPGRHVKTIADLGQRRLAQIRSQGPVHDTQIDNLALARAHAEAGGDALEMVARPGTWLVGLESDQGIQSEMPAAAMSCNVGGMGSHWTCACPLPGEGERITLITPSELDAAFIQAEELLGVSRDAFADAPLGAEVRAALAARFDAGRPAERRVQPMPLALRVDTDGSRRWSGPDVILGGLPAGFSPGFELRPETICRQIEMDGGSAVGVVLHDRVLGEDYQVGTRAVVVACDPFRSPQLLWASGLGNSALGHYLNDQPQATGTVLLDDRFIPAGGPAPSRPAGQAEILSGVSWVPYDGDAFPYHGQIMQRDASPVPLAGEGEPWPGSVVECGLFAAKEIRYEDRVEFDAAALDCFGLPAITIHYALTDADQRATADMITMIESMTELLGRPVNGYPPVALPAGSSLHFQGTTRMGDVDDGSSVCNTHSRVWGTTNVHVAGNGVIPTATACNPTLTTVALATRGARRLAERLMDR